MDDQKQLKTSKKEKPLEILSSDVLGPVILKTLDLKNVKKLELIIESGKSVKVKVESEIINDIDGFKAILEYFCNEYRLVRVDNK